MKAAQELLIFPFPNFFTFFIMWYLKEKNPSPTVIQKQIQTNHSKKKKHDVTQAFLLPVGLGPF